MAYIITEPCVGVKDKACVAVCPVDCIYEIEDMLFIHTDECVDCSACEPECPVEAIFEEDEVPEKWAAYTKLNYDLSAMQDEGNTDMATVKGMDLLGK
ncbi:MAG: ferredoxin family protein [Gemmatimonadetes bacterium]|nr:MAG: ferredoxin family protein [Gemmatimonadota bacterium]